MASDFSPDLTFTIPALDGGDPAVIHCGIYHSKDPDDASYGITEQWTEQGFSITIPFVCAYEDRFDLIRGLRGRVGPADQNGSFKRVGPSITPYLNDGGAGPTNLNYLTCVGTGPFERIHSRVSQESDDTEKLPDPGWSYSDLVIVPAYFETATYQSFDGAQRGDPSRRWYTTTTFKDAGEIICPPSGAYRYKDNPQVKVQDTQVGIYKALSEITIVRHFVPFSGAALLQTVKGCTNDADLQMGDTTYPEGTLLMTGISSRSYSNPASLTIVYDVTFTLLATIATNLPGQGGKQAPPNRWDQIMNPQGVYATIEDANGNPPFAVADFEKAIWPDQKA